MVAKGQLLKPLLQVFLFRLLEQASPSVRSSSSNFYFSNDKSEQARYNNNNDDDDDDDVDNIDSILQSLFYFNRCSEDASRFKRQW